jgi:hypothetical protein
MNKIWFIAQGQSIRGPFSTVEVEKFLATGSLTTSSLIWWKGEPAWHTVGVWKTNLPHILRTLEPQEEKEWFIQHGTDHWGPVSKTEVLQTLESAFDPTIFRLWRVGLEKWQSIYHFEDICVHLGIQKRQNTRVPMIGSANIETAYDQIIANTITVSQGGFGLLKTPLPSGSIVRVTLKSPVLPIPIRTTAEVRFSSSDGYTGLKFENLTAEARSAIMDYIKKFKGAA